MSFVPSALKPGRAARLALARSAGPALVAALVFGACAVTENLLVRMFHSEVKDGKLVNGKQEGEWVYRYPSGALKARGTYKNDKQIGPWTYWYENGNVEWQGEFGEHRIEGPVLFGQQNGKRRAVGMFVDGLEEDLWTYWTPDGALECEGDYVHGKPSLRWTYFHPDGTPMAEGFRYEGERVGPWQFTKPGGELSERRFPLPAGVEIVHETWDGDVPRREGFLVQGVQSGRWVTWHPNGRRRTTGDFAEGKPQGLWIAWASTGEPLARGHMTQGRPDGDWVLTRGGASQHVQGSSLALDLTFAGTWSTDGVASAAGPERTLATWIAEASSPLPPTMNEEPDPNVPAPPADYVARTETVPAVALRSQPWTVNEDENLAFLVKRYSESNAQPPRGSSYGRRRTHGALEAEQGDPVLSPRFLGTQLPWTRFYKADGGVVDLDESRGKSKVVLTVLRGFAREVCVYCITQTEALCDNVDAFRKEGCEVFVVYPGERNRLDAFLESFRTVSKHMGEPPIGVLYDRNMELVNRMGIQSEFAIPSTFVLDEKGVIRYAYVGRDIEDRPSAEAVLKAIRELPSS